MSKLALLTAQEFLVFAARWSVGVDWCVPTVKHVAVNARMYLIDGRSFHPYPSRSFHLVDTLVKLFDVFHKNFSYLLSQRCDDSRRGRQSPSLRVRARLGGGHSLDRGGTISVLVTAQFPARRHCGDVWMIVGGTGAVSVLVVAHTPPRGYSSLVSVLIWSAVCGVVVAADSWSLHTRLCAYGAEHVVPLVR